MSLGYLGIDYFYLINTCESLFISLRSNSCMCRTKCMCSEVWLWLCFMATEAEGRTDVAFSTCLDQSLAVLHLKEEVCVLCVCGGPAVPICSH